MENHTSLNTTTAIPYDDHNEPETVGTSHRPITRQ